LTGDRSESRPNLISIARATATSAAFETHSEIADVLHHYPDFDTVAEWFEDPIFQAQLDELVTGLLLDFLRDAGAR
jgi:hypothetical protein